MDLFAAQQASQIPGAQYIQNYISLEEHNFLLTCIDKSPWLDDLQRRVQHYGYKYSYKNRSVDSSMWLGPLPEWIQRLANKLQEQNLMHSADQAIINEYLPGQGIASHTDCITCFDRTVAIITLGSGCIMNFQSPDYKKEHIFLQPRSLLVLSDEARYDWKHEIAKRKTDLIGGHKHYRERRVSMTFRKVILES